MRLLTPILSVSAAAAVLSAGTMASAELLVNIDFGPVGQDAVGVGVVGDADDSWDNLSAIDAAPTIDTLTNPDTGAPSGFSFFGEGAQGASGGVFSVAGPSTNVSQDYDFFTTSNPSNFGSLEDGTFVSASQRFTIFGLPALLSTDLVYDIYVIGGGNAPGQGASIALTQDDGLGGETLLIESYSGTPVSGDPTTYVEGSNFVLFESVSPTAVAGTNPNNEFEFDVFIPAGQTGTATISGVQIVLVPEPGSMALLALGGVACFARRRRD